MILLHAMRSCSEEVSEQISHVEDVNTAPADATKGALSW